MTASDDIILAAVNLTKSFGFFTAVDGVNLNVRRGSIHALIGPNGAGKTTCFNLLSKFHSPTNGTITYNGRDITGLKPPEVARQGMVRSFQISSTFPSLSALANVRVALQQRRRTNLDFWRSNLRLRAFDDEAMGLLEKVGLASLAGRRAGELPYGRKRALEIATTLALEPEMMLLDEPMAGLGQEDIERIEALIREIARGRTILMVEHNLPVVASLSDRITVLARGKVLAEGDYDAISNDQRVIEAYIGSGEFHGH